MSVQRALSHSKFETMALVEAFFLFIGDIGDVVHGKETWKSEYRKHYVLLISAISLMMMMQYPCRSLMYYGIMRESASTTHNPRVNARDIPTVPKARLRRPGQYSKTAAPGKAPGRHIHISCWHASPAYASSSLVGAVGVQGVCRSQTLPRTSLRANAFALLRRRQDRPDYRHN